MLNINAFNLFCGLRVSARNMVVAVGIGLAGLISSGGAQADEYPALKLRFGHPYNEAHPLAQGHRNSLIWWESEAADRSISWSFPTALSALRVS